MTNSKIFKKLASAASAIVLAVTASISFAMPAHAANTTLPSFTFTNGVASYTAGTWTGANTTNPLWLICETQQNSATGTNGSSSPDAGCGPYAATDQTGTSGGSIPWIRPNASTPTTLPFSAYKWVSSSGMTITTALREFNTRHLAVYESNGSDWVMSATVAISGITGSSPAPSTPNVIAPIINLANEARSTIQNSLQTVKDKGVSAHGGRVIIDEMNAADIDTVTLNGKALKVRVSENGTSIAIPAGSKSGDLVFTLADGSKVTIYDAVNIAPSSVNPDKVAKISLPAAFTGNSTSVPASVKKAIMKREDEILESGNAQCVGYATGSSAKAQATALTRAKKVCGIISDINEEIEPLVKVVVNKATARKSPVKYQIW